jgi:type I restriction enzyme R subunit
LEYTPFDSKGGLGGFYRVFGEKYQEILDEMNEELVA